jgi:hypothetical protein
MRAIARKSVHTRRHGFGVLNHVGGETPVSAM